MNKKNFIKMMTDYKSLIDDIDGVHNAMTKLDPDFGGFCISRVENYCFKLIELIMGDKDGWIEYYIYDLGWGKKWTKTSMSDENNKSIKLKTLEDLYKLLTDNQKLK
jgi:hypothetical protein